MANLKKNIAYNTVYHILILILPLITAPYVSRILGPEGIGIYSYTNSVAHYFVVFSMLGLTKYGNRTIARVKDNKEELSKTFCNLYALQAIISIIAIIAYSIYFFGFNQQYRILFFIQLLQVCSALFNINWFFFGMEQFKLTVTRNTLIKVAATIAIFVFVKKPSDLGIYIGITTGSILLSDIVLWRFLFRHIKIVKPDKKNILSHLKPLIILFIPVIALNIFRSMDKIIITLLSDVTQTGLYENADKIVTIPLSIITALGTVMLPRMSNIIAKGNEEMSKRYIRDSMQFVLGLAIGIMFGIAVIAEIFAPLFFGEAFIQTGSIIKYMTPIIFLTSWNNVIRTQHIIPQEKDKIYIIALILGAVINLVLNIIFIPLYGALGAVIGTLAAFLAVFIYQTINTRKELNVIQYLKDNYLFFISGALMYLIVNITKKFIGSGYWQLIVLIIIGVMVYTSASICLYFIWKKDRFNRFKTLLFGRTKKDNV